MRLVLTQPSLAANGSVDHRQKLYTMLSGASLGLSPEDIVLLPEHWELGTDPASYTQAVTELAQALGCHVVGGTQHQHRGDHLVNTGVVSNNSGEVVGSYEKQRPYALEQLRVRPGHQLGEFCIAGRRVAVLVCADFWFSDLFDRLEQLPDLVLVPALSVTRKSTPDYSRSLWRHLAIARAYEFGVYVGVSDWSATSDLGNLRTAGASGLADPTQTNPAEFFTPVDGDLQVFELDFDELERFRQDRRERGFFWTPSSSEPSKE